MKKNRREMMRKAIQESDFNIPHIARIAVIDKQTIYNFLNGKSGITLRNYDRIIDACA